MKHATLYHRASGAILAALSGPDDANFDLYATTDAGIYPDSLDKATQYVIDGSPLTVGTRTEVVFTAPTDVTLGDPVTLSGLPDPCWVKVDGNLHEVIGGAITRTPAFPREITVELVGRYSGTISIFVHTDCAASLNADARWQALLAATPQQIENWLTTNATNLAEVRVVLKLLLLAVRKLEH